MQKIKKYKIVAVIIAVIILPLVYSFFYLDAFWDPYSKLDELPVAVVNQDAGAVIDGENKNIGNEIINTVKSDSTLNWVITSDEDAKDGIENRRYYASIYIPSDFTKSISTAGDSSKTQGTIIYNVNEKRNFLASQVLSRVTLEFKDNISKTVSKEIVDNLVSQFKSVPDDLKTLNDGLGKLTDGTNTLYNKTGELVKGQKAFNGGLNTLNNGLNGAATGTKSLSSGSKTLSDGANLFSDSLASGSQKVDVLSKGSQAFSAGISTVNNGLGQLNAGVGQLSKGSSDLSKNTGVYSQSMQGFSTGLSTYVSTVNKATDATAGLAAYVKSYTASHPEALTDPNFQAIVKTLQASQGMPEQVKKAGETLVSSGKSLTEAAGKINAGATKITTGLNAVSQNSVKLSKGADNLNTSYSKINAGIKDVNGSISLAATKSKDLSTGASKIKAGADALNEGITKASAGSKELYDNSLKLYDGENKLLDGIKTLNEGMTTASEGVSESLSKSDGKLGGIDGLSEYVSEPVRLASNRIDKIPDYGTAFTPYFVSLSLWVGALMMFFAIYLDPEIKFRRSSKKSNGLLRYASYSIIAIAQAIILNVVIIGALHLEVKNIALFYLVSIIIALSFTSIMRFLLVQLGSVGKFFAVLFLILQLTACGGTFPMELVPNFFNVINPFMPMTYSVNALKEVISGIDYGYLAQNVFVLIAIIVTFFAANLILSKIRLGKLMADADEPDEDSESISA